MEPAGFIPPEFREFVYGQMTEKDIQLAMDSMAIMEDDGRYRKATRQEVLKEAKKVIGVKDTRTGEIRYNQSNTPTFQVDVRL